MEPRATASTSTMTPRGLLLRAAAGFALVKADEPELRVLRSWLNCWRGVGDVVTGMERQGYRLHLTNIDSATWRATFSGHAMSAAEGFGADQTPWGAVQQAAWRALNR